MTDATETNGKKAAWEASDWLSADMAIGIVVQCGMDDRDALEAYCTRHELVPYLRFFLERRGWLDEDWEARLTRLERDWRQGQN